jgi:hypothetical protein
MWALTDKMHYGSVGFMKTQYLGIWSIKAANVTCRS